MSRFVPLGRARHQMLAQQEQQVEEDSGLQEIPSRGRHYFGSLNAPEDEDQASKQSLRCACGLANMCGCSLT
jgi:hypothetical protein